MDLTNFNLRLLMVLQLVAIFMLLAEHGNFPWIIAFTFIIVDLIIATKFLI